MNEKAEPTIGGSENSHAYIRCRLRADSTMTMIGNGTPCSYLIRARRADPESELCVTEIDSTHSCPATVRHKRNSTDSSVGPVYTREKLKDLVQKWQDCLATESSQSQNENTTSEASSSASDPKARARRPVRESARVERYIFEPPLQRSRTPPATVSKSSKRTLQDARVELHHPKSTFRRKSAPAWSAASARRSVPSRQPRLSDTTASGRVTPNSGALGPARPPAVPLRTSGLSTVSLHATPNQILASMPPTAPSTSARSTQSGPIRRFLATTFLVPAQRDVLARALESAGVLGAEDVVKLLFFHNDILKAFGDELLVGSAESWPADARVRTITEALQAVVEGARVEAKLGKSS